MDIDVRALRSGTLRAHRPVTGQSAEFPP